MTRWVMERLEGGVLLAARDLDGTFGGGEGIRLLDFSGGHDIAHDVAVQADGKIVVVGEADFPGSLTIPAGRYSAIARFNADGSLDDGGVNDSTPGDSFFGAGKRFLHISAGNEIDA